MEGGRKCPGSAVWDHFDLFEEKKDKRMHCMQHLAFCNNTTMWRHLRIKHPDACISFSTTQPSPEFSHDQHSVYGMYILHDI